MRKISECDDIVEESVIHEMMSHKKTHPPWKKGDWLTSNKKDRDFGMR